MHKNFLLKNLDDVDALALKFSRALFPGLVIYLEGNLGVGKTTFVQTLLKILGYQGRVKSPTYTIVEPYQIELCDVNHFDLYRLSDAEELEYLGLDEYFHKNSLAFIEWSSHGGDQLPKADIIFNYHYEGEARQLNILANSPLGEQVLKEI